MYRSPVDYYQVKPAYTSRCRLWKHFYRRPRSILLFAIVIHTCESYIVRIVYDCMHIVYTPLLCCTHTRTQYTLYTESTRI